MILCSLTGILIGAGIGALIGYVGKCSSGVCLLTATPLRGAIFGAIFGLFIVMSNGCPWSTSSAYDKNATDGGLYIRNADDFEKLVVESQNPVMVNFYSPTCLPCRRLAPTIVTLKEKYSGRADVYKIDVTELPELAGLYHVQAVPTVLFFVNGNEAGRVTGNNYESVYTDILDTLVRDKQVLPVQQ